MYLRTPRLKRIVNCQRGQGTVEYVLLLVISVAIIIGLSAQFYAPFGRWADRWLGDYVVCLLDEGKLPILMGEEETDDCATRFQAGAAARPGRGSPIDSQTRRRDNNNASSSDGGSSQSTAGASSRSGQAGGASGQTKSSAMDGTVDGGGVSGKGQSSTPTEYYNVGQGEIQQSGQGRSKITKLSVNQLVEYERDKLKNRKNRIFRYGSLDEDPAGRNKKIIKIDPTRQRSKTIETQIEPWNFAKFFRLGIVLIIIVFTLLFLLLQGVRIAKSIEK